MRTKIDSTLLDAVAAVENSSIYKTEGIILDFTERICEILAERGISRAEFARMLGRSKAWVTKLLRGDHNMTVATIVQVMNTLGHDVEIDVREFGTATVGELPYCVIGGETSHSKWSRINSDDFVELQLIEGGKRPSVGVAA